MTRKAARTTTTAGARPYGPPLLLGLLGLLWIGPLWISTGPRAQTPTETISAKAVAAEAVVEKLHEKLLENMRRADELGYPGRYRELEPILEASYEMPLICKIVVGSHWRQLSEEQRADFISLFTKLSIAFYADSFASYSGESFVSRKVKTLRKGRMLVKTELKEANGQTIVTLDYLLNPAPSGWRIISVIAQGVNDLSMKRAEYGEVLRKQSFPELLEFLGRKLEAIEKKNALKDNPQ